MTRCAEDRLCLAFPDVARLMPLSVLVGKTGLIEAVGPTLSRIAGPLEGVPFLDVFQVKRPRRMDDLADLATAAHLLFEMGVPDGDPIALRAVAVPLGGTPSELLINFSLGIGIREVVDRYGLTLSDFATTDLAIEMLYLIEAKHASTTETRDLIARLQDARSDAEARSMTDALTGLPNRRGFEHHVRRLSDVGASFAVMAIDLDHFKAVNDQYGHAVGDAVLKEAAARLSATLRSADIVARVGGDEFLAILRETSDAQVLNTAGERLIRAMEAPIDVDGAAHRIGASVGIAVTKGGLSEEPGALIDRADAALYRSKNAGRGVVTHAEQGV